MFILFIQFKFGLQEEVTYGWLVF